MEKKQDSGLSCFMISQNELEFQFYSGLKFRENL